MIECTYVTSMRGQVVVCDVQKMWNDTFKTPEFVTVLFVIMIFTDLYGSVITWHSRTVCLETVTERMHHICVCACTRCRFFRFTIVERRKNNCVDRINLSLNAILKK